MSSADGHFRQPDGGSVVGWDGVTITGTNFTGATAVDFGTIAATSYTVDSATRSRPFSPRRSTATVDITVTKSGW